MLGLAIKGGVWIGFAGTFLGMGLSGKRYDCKTLIGLFAMMVALLFLGVHFLNRPFDIPNRELPTLYFSDDWRWEDDVTKPRRECWGGLWAALIGLLVVVFLFKKDSLALKLGCWGILAGALGFPCGQMIQASNAWGVEWNRFLPEAGVSKFNWLSLIHI